MSPTLTRRRALTVALSAPVAAAVPAAMPGGADAKLRALVERWRALDAEAINRPPGLTDDAAEERVDALADRMAEIADAMADTAAESIVGVLLKLSTSDAIYANDDGYAHGRMILTAIEDLERLTGS